MKKRIPIRYISYILSFILLLWLPSGCTKSMANEDGSESLETNHYDNRTFGLSAKDLLSDERFTSLKVEIQHMAGFEPDPAALRHLKSFLYTHLHKKDGITITTSEIDAHNDTVISRKEVIAIEKKNRTVFTKGKQIAVYILYTNTDFTDNKTLGWAYGNTSAVIYGKAINDNSNKIGKPSRSTLESTILLHEFGHLIGLLHKDTPTATVHKDEAHESHCNNRKCLMYYGIDLEDRFGHLIKRSIPKLDKDCLDDLENIRNKGIAVP